MKIVTNWQKAWRWHSVWLAGLIAAIPAAWVSMPADLKEYVPTEWMPYVSGVMFVAFLVGRLRDQGE